MVTSDSAIVFLSFIGFLAFGYLSILRLLVKREFSNASGTTLIGSLKTTQVFSSLGSSAFFISMPATSLLLFWGWAPALFWLLIFHIFIESLLHFQYTTTEQDLSLTELLIGSNGRKMAYIESALVQGFFILLMAIMVSLLSTLIDQQSGLLLALIALIPAQQMFRNENPILGRTSRIISTFIILGIGVILAHKLGFSVYGTWAPLAPLASLSNSLDWFTVNNTTLIASILIIISFVLAKKGQFQTDIATFSGIAITLLIIVMIIRLLWLQPVLDAPMSTSQNAETNLPTFAAFCLFSFAGLSALLIRLLNDETIYADTNTSFSCYNRLQSESLFQLVFSVLIVLSLAAALGIGAWKTHYNEWTSSMDFGDHLTLAMKGILQLVSSSFRIGTFAHTAIMACICVAGISFSMMCVNRFKITRHSFGDDKSIFDVVMSAKLPQAIIIFVLCCYFIEKGIPVSAKLFSGVLSWALIVHLMLSITKEMPDDSRSSIIYSLVCIILMVAGSLQVVGLCIQWFDESNYLNIAISALILSGVWILWWPGTLSLLPRFRLFSAPKEIELE